MTEFGEMRGWSDFERNMWNGGYGPAGAWWMRDDDGDDDFRLSDGSSPAITITAPDPYDAEHAIGCTANDLDPLDHSPCICGLRTTVNPWGRTHP